MMPPSCGLCGRTDGCDLVAFAKTAEDEEFERDVAQGATGHPPRAEWFCGAHEAPARALAHLTRVEALARLRAPPEGPIRRALRRIFGR